MALFSITRYMGDGDHRGSSTSEDILQKLHSKAKQKSRNIPAENLPEHPCHEEKPLQGKHFVADEDLCRKRKTKKRKAKLEDNADTSIQQTEIVSANCATSGRKKKHKHDQEVSARSPSKDISFGIDSSFNATTNNDIISDVDLTATVKLKSESSVGNSENNSDTDPSIDDDDVMSDDEIQEDEANTSQQQTHTDVGGFTVIGHVKNQSKEKVERVLPDWLAKPSVITADIRKKRVSFSDIPELDLDIVEKLKENGIADFFPVQGQLIPAVLSSVDLNNSHILGKAGYRPCDVCCSAPTGSGKTLAYVLPVIQCLRRRVVRKLRALVILPVIDLAAQVFKVFQSYCACTDLKVGLAIGQKTFIQEQHMLVKKCYDGFESNIDILVATPSRMVDHISKTQGLDLTHLRYLIIDEADRMMEEFKHNWLSQVEGAVYADASIRVAPTALDVTNASKARIPLQKLLFSATLSQNPEKLQQMRLFHPRLFTAVVMDTSDTVTPQDEGVTSNDAMKSTGKEAISQEVVPVSPVRGEFVGKYTTPSGLTEYFVESSAGEKPLVIMHYLHALRFKRILCFTNSVEATHRLYWLVKLVGGVEVQEFSSGLPPNKRTKLLRKFAAGKIDMLICSDAMARGMDVDNVQCVISYELPQYLKTYIHRVGRTARAGRAGTAITLLEKKQIAYFKRMLKEAGKTGVKEMKLRNALLKPYVNAYQQALRDMPDILKNERKNQRQS